MHTTPNRVTTMDQLYNVASQMQAPVLIHADGEIEWSNSSFTQRFGVKTEAGARIKVKELLWCLGVIDAICGMVAEGITFRHCELPSPNPGESAVRLKHQVLPMLSDGRKRMMLVLADEFDPEPMDICIGDN
jgi:hypothetical protein